MCIPTCINIVSQEQKTTQVLHSRVAVPNSRKFNINKMALTCGQVSEVSSHGEVSSPNFGPKITAHFNGEVHDEAFFARRAQQRNNRMAILGQQFGIAGNKITTSK